ncbi:MAG: DNA-processing protein DprA [Chitinophagales bacterium]|nr:DNA-processing protein DprA [Chitinophagales bacterium]
MSLQELKYLIALKEIKGVGDILSRFLISHVGSAEDVFKMGASKLLKIPRISESVAKEIIQFNQFGWIEDEILWCEQNDIQIVAFNQKEYPKRLLECHDAPLFLFVKGTHQLNTTKIVSIVGTRNITEYGKEVTEQIIKSLQSLDVTVVSGLALGVDGVAHKKCIELQVPTIAVLGHALDQIYPFQHKELSKKIAKQGALISEFSRNTTFNKNNFPMRNRIVAGMSDATILIESALKGGSMITAEIAHSYGREVFAIPGRWNDPVSQGANYLIKNLKAQILTQPNDLAELMGWKIKEQLIIDGFFDNKAKFQHLEENERKIVACMNSEPVSIDILHYSTEIPIGELSAILLSLELKGILKALPGKRFQLK